MESELFINPDVTRFSPFRRGMAPSKEEIERKLKRLSRLNCKGSLNRLSPLPEWVRELQHLEQLGLAHNGLTSLPMWIGEFKSLEVLDLSSNNLESLPFMITYLRKMRLLSLIDNRQLANIGQGDELGREELVKRLGERVKLDPKDPEGPVTEVSMEEVYGSLDLRYVHWNREALKHLKPDAVGQDEPQGSGVLDIWQKDLKGHVVGENMERNKDVMESYVKVLFDIPGHTVDVWKMYDFYIDRTRKLVAGIFSMMKEVLDGGNSEDIAQVEASLTGLGKGMGSYPDVQVSTLNEIYSKLCGTYEDSFESFIKREVAVLKEYIFKLAISLGEDVQNADVLNILKDELGLVDGYESTEEGGDGLFAYPGNVLQMFYTKFTPGYVIGKLRGRINEDRRRLDEAIEFVTSRIEDEEYGDTGAVFDVVNEEGIERPTSIRDKGVEGILLGMGILEKVGLGTTQLAGVGSSISY